MRLKRDTLPPSLALGKALSRSLDFGSIERAACIHRPKSWPTGADGHLGEMGPWCALARAPAKDDMKPNTSSSAYPRTAVPVIKFRSQRYGMVYQRGNSFGDGSGNLRVVA